MPNSIASVEIKVRKPGKPWCRYAVTWPEYANTYVEEAKERGWPDIRVIKRA